MSIFNYILFSSESTIKSWPWTLANNVTTISIESRYMCVSSIINQNTTALNIIIQWNPADIWKTNHDHSFVYWMEYPTGQNWKRFTQRGHFIIGLTSIRAWRSNHMPGTVWDEITYPFPNLIGYTVEVWEWINNFIAHFIMDVDTYPCWD